MATGQTLLDLMEDMHPELQLQSGEANVSKGLRLLNAAQDAFETVVAGYPDVLGGGTGTVTTTSSTESTAFPTGLLRLDDMWFIDPSTSRPLYKLNPIEETGGHSYSRGWPGNLLSTSTSGRPVGAWTNGANIYWDPLPDATHTVRWYGFEDAADITAGGTFTYQDGVIFPLVMMERTGLDDPIGDLNTLAETVFQPLVAQLSRFNRQRGKRYQYKYSHGT